jgi:hypothetical protein
MGSTDPPGTDEEQGRLAAVGVPESNHILDRFAKRNMAASRVDSGGLPYFFRQVIVLLIFRPNFLCPV